MALFFISICAEIAGMVGVMKKKLKRITKIILKKVLPIKLLLNNKNFSRFIEIYKPEELNKSSNKIITFKFRNKYNFIKTDLYVTNTNFREKVGVLLQGPLKKEDDFTYYTLLNYVKILPKDCIVVSTWRDEDCNYIKKIEKLGVKVILNEKPNVSGFGNVNLQIRTTQSALGYLKGVGCKYVAKTRTDTRIEKGNAYDFLIALLRTFKLNGNKINQKDRIVLIDFDTRLERPFNMSDIFQFGNIDDLISVWNIDEDKRENTFSNDIVYTEKELFDLEIAENYIMKRFLDKIGIAYEYNLESYYKLLAKRFIIIDSNQIEHYWYKYFNIEQPQPFQKNNCASFSEWLILYDKFKKTEEE